MDLFDDILKVHSVEEATVKDLMRKQRSITRLFPSFPDRVKGVAGAGGVRLDNIDKDSWDFKIHSASKNVWYDVSLHFKDIVKTLAEVVKDRRLWVKDKSRIDKRKLARKMLNVVDIQLKCSCPADSFWGGQYIRSLDKYDAKVGDKETRPPKVRNPKKYGAYCKHIANLMRVLPFYNDTMMRYLDDFYSKEILQFEEDARKEYSWVKAVSGELAKKKKDVAKEMEPEVLKGVAEEPKKKAVPTPSYDIADEKIPEKTPEKDDTEQKKLDQEARRNKRKAARDDRLKRQKDNFRAKQELSYPIEDEEATESKNTEV